VLHRRLFPLLSPFIPHFAEHDAIAFSTVACCGLIAATAASGGDYNDPDFNECLYSVRTHLAGATNEDLTYRD